MGCSLQTIAASISGNELNSQPVRQQINQNHSLDAA